jgi:GDPmannose 4,6-dehydratase
MGYYVHSTFKLVVKVMSSQNKVAFITGITGQDGSYLAELLLSKGYTVHGLVRKASHFTTERLEHLYSKYEGGSDRFKLHYGDVTDFSRLSELITKSDPNEIYNLAAQSHVKVSFEMPILTADAVAIGCLNILEILRINQHHAKFYQASSSEMFGSAVAPQNEETVMLPNSPYAAAKFMAHNLVGIYRSAYGIQASAGILFNHESPRRHESFVTRKITKGAAEISSGQRKRIKLGNLSARRDWGFAPEYVYAMWQMLQQDEPQDYVIATGTSYSVEDFLQFTFEALNLEWRNYVEYDSNLERPIEVPDLCGDASKAKANLGWEARTHGRKLAEIMIEADLVDLTK